MELSTVSIHPINKEDNSQDNHQQEPGTPDNKLDETDSRRCGKMEYTEKSVTEWIKGNIKKRVCTTFISKDGDKCGCGYTKDNHENGQQSESQEQTWDVETNTKDEPTDAFGEVEFQGFGQKIGQYVRVDKKTEMNKIIELITEVWGLKLPNLLISVTGGAKNFQMKPQLKEVFRRGLVKVARSTGAWVTSAGLNAGVMKHVGEAIRDYGFTLSGRDKVVAIGIAPWGCVENKDDLIHENGLWPAQYHIEEANQEGVSPLDPNHSYFILVDDGTQNIFGTEIEFRANLEKEIANMKISDTDVKIPAVVVMVEGGPGTLKTVYNSVDNKTPVIIVKGSGRAADIMAYAYQNASEDDRTKKLVLSEQLQKDLKNRIKEFGFKEDCFGFVRDSLKHPNLITVFEIGSKDSARDIDMAVLKALLKANKEKLRNLRLTLEWNRIDVAKSEIFTDDTQWTTGKLDDLMVSALLLDRVDFVKLFLDYGVSLKTFLSKDRLEELYKKTVEKSSEESSSSNVNNDETVEKSSEESSSSNENKDKTVEKSSEESSSSNVNNDETVEKSSEESSSSNVNNDETGVTSSEESSSPNENKNKSETLYVDKVADVINSLMGNDKFRYSLNLNDDPKEPYRFPAKELFLWAVLMNRREMAFLFWKECMEALPAALVANRLLKAMKQRSKDYEEKNKLQAHADLFEERAIGVLTECYASDEKMAQQLLVQQRDNWGETSCMLIAVNADNKRFISHTACQSLLSNIWMGKMNNSNSVWKLIISIFCPLFVLLLIDFNKQNTGKDQDTEVNNSNGSNEKDYTWEKKIFFFYTAPVITFIANVGFYVVFLIIFSYILLVEFQEEPSNLEYFLYAWVFTIFVEELRQVLAKYSSSIRIKLINYITDVWNIVDVTNILLFVAGVLIRYLHQVEVARVILCLNLILFYFRILHIFSVHKELGPKLVMIKKMVQDLGYFVAILFVFMVAYGIASQAILYPSTPFSLQLFKGVLKKPYFQMYGELFLPEIEGEECNQTSVVDTFEHRNDLNKCPTQLGTQIVPLMMCIYILLTNVLLLNLLIAMFSNTFQNIQDNTDLHWHFLRFGLISEYYTRPPLPPPFILLSHIYLVLCILTRKDGTNTAFKKKLSEEEKKKLMHFEDEMADNYLMNKEKFINNSMEGKVSLTSDRVDQIMMKVEELQHQQQHSLLFEIRQIGSKLETRLAKLENQIKEVKEIHSIPKSNTKKQSFTSLSFT